MKTEELYAAVEAVLFVSGESVAVKDIAAAIEQDTETANLLIKSLALKINAENRGFKIIEINGSYQMCTNPAYFSFVAKIGRAPQKKNLTPPLLETLAIIAYKQPVTKADIEAIRGVDATHTVNKLVEYELVCETGRDASPGRPILFGTTDKFLAHFGFTNLSELPGFYDTLEKIRGEEHSDNMDSIPQEVTE
ncbi:MAG: SMC-Scp complex subunit ScpB [Clostridiales bacterium]|jgi:segregation and condensation protein B|nr:SMC-Scp complex subunit ScpB [Clostridiales bacterium]